MIKTDETINGRMIDVFGDDSLTLGKIFDIAIVNGDNSRILGKVFDIAIVNEATI